MAQDLLVDELRTSGKRLLGEIVGAGVEVTVAFWAKPEGHEQWCFYIATPLADHSQTPSVQRVINGIARQLQGSWVDPLQIRVLGATDSTALAAIEFMTSKVIDHEFAVQRPAPNPDSWYPRSTLGGLDIDPPAYIYRLPQPATVA